MNKENQEEILKEFGAMRNFFNDFKKKDEKKRKKLQKPLVSLNKNRLNLYERV